MAVATKCSANRSERSSILSAYWGVVLPVLSQWRQRPPVSCLLFFKGSLVLLFSLESWCFPSWWPCKVISDCSHLSAQCPAIPSPSGLYHALHSPEGTKWTWIQTKGMDSFAGTPFCPSTTSRQSHSSGWRAHSDDTWGNSTSRRWAKIFPTPAGLGVYMHNSHLTGQPTWMFKAQVNDAIRPSCADPQLLSLQR